MRVQRTKGAVLAVLTVLAGITHAAYTGQVYIDTDPRFANAGYWNDDDYVGADWRSTAAERPADLNRTRATDPADLDLLADDWLKTTTWHK